MKKLLLILFMLTGIAYAQDQTIGRRTNTVRVLGRLAVDSMDLLQGGGDTVIYKAADGTLKLKVMYPDGGSSESTIDSFKLYPTRFCMWKNDLMTCIEFGRYHDSAHRNIARTHTLYYNNGTLLSDSSELNHDPVYGRGRIIVSSHPSTLFPGSDSVDIKWDSTGIVAIQNGLLIPGTVFWSGAGLKYYITGATYVINGVQYVSGFDSVTLAVADPTFPRKDVITLDTTGHAVVVTGIAADPPLIPQVDPNSQLQPLTVADLAAGATTPTNVAERIIYDEFANFTGTSAAGLTVDYASTTAPYHLTVNTDVGAWAVPKFLVWTTLTPLNPYDYAVLKFTIRLKAAFPASANIGITWLKTGTGVVANNIVLGPTNGFNRNLVGVDQVIAIPISQWLFTNNFTTIYFTLYGAAAGFYIDYISLQNGINNGSSQFLTNVFKSNDSLYQTRNNTNYFVGLVSGGGGGTGSTDSTLQRILDNEFGNAALNKADTITAGANTLRMTFNGITSNPGLNIVSTSTAAASQTQRLLNVALSGTNASTGQDTYAAYIQNNHVDPDGFNYGLYASAGGSGAANIAIKGQADNANGQGVAGISAAGYGVFALTSIGTGVYSQATSGTAIQGTSGTGTGVSAQSQSAGGIGLDAGAYDGTPGRFFAGSSSANSVIPVLDLSRTPFAAGADGIGQSIDFKLQTDASNLSLANQLISSYISANDAARTSRFEITGINAGSTETFMSIQTGGIVPVNNFADTLATKAYARSLSGGGGVGNTIYTGDGTLAGPRALSLGGNSLSFSEGSTFFTIDPVVGSESINIQAFDNTDDGNTSGFLINTAPESSYLLMKTSFNDGVKIASIQELSSATTSDISYTADTHTFAGAIINNADTSTAPFNVVTIDENNQLRRAAYPAGVGGGSGLLHVVAASGLQNVNDSTLKLADSVRTGIYTGLASKVNLSDTAAMLSNYQTAINTNAVNIALKADKTITLTANSPITGGGNLSANRSLGLDTTSGTATSAVTQWQRKKTSDSLLALIVLKLGISDTAAMLSPYKTSYPRQAISLTTTGSGAATYSNSTGILNVPTPTAGGGAADSTLFWQLPGNAPAFGTFIGTTINRSLRFRTKNVEAMAIDSATQNVGIGISVPVARLQVLSTTEQIRNAYDATHYMSVTSASTGSTTFELTGTTPTFTFGKAVAVTGTISTTTNIQAGVGGNISDANNIWKVDLTGIHLAAASTIVGWTSAGAGGTMDAAFSRLGAGKIAVGTGAANSVAGTLVAANIGIGQSTPTAYLHLAAGTATASTAPLKLTSGTNLSAVENGTIEYNGTDFFGSSNSVRYKIVKETQGTAAPATTPSSIGEIYVDSTNKKMYVATGTASSADWTILN